MKVKKNGGKMKKTLSDKRKELEQRIVNGEIDIRSVFVLIEKQDREFISDLEDFIGNCRFKISPKSLKELYDFIEKRAGDTLSGTNKGPDVEKVEKLVDEVKEISKRINKTLTEDTRNTVSPLAPSIKGCGKLLYISDGGRDLHFCDKYELCPVCSKKKGCGKKVENGFYCGEYKYLCSDCEEKK